MVKRDLDGERRADRDSDQMCRPAKVPLQGVGYAVTG